MRTDGVDGQVSIAMLHDQVSGHHGLSCEQGLVMICMCGAHLTSASNATSPSFSCSLASVIAIRSNHFSEEGFSVQTHSFSAIPQDGDAGCPADPYMVPPCFSQSSKVAVVGIKKSIKTRGIGMQIPSLQVACWCRLVPTTEQRENRYVRSRVRPFRPETISACNHVLQYSNWRLVRREDS